MYEGGEGRAQPILWCGTEQGLATFDGRSFELVLSDLNITSLIRDRKGAVWCGTGKGLQYKPADGGAWQSVNWSERVECLLVDRAGGVWCGTQEALRHFDGSRWQVLHADGFLMGVQCLLEDRHGRIWCGTHKELVILRPQGNNLYVPVALEEALNPPVPEVPPPVFAASMTGESTDRSPKNSTPVRPPQVADEHKREPFPPKAPQAVSDTQPPKNPQPLPQPSSPPEGLVKTKQAFRYPSFALPSGEQLNWLAVAALILAVFATGNWLESKNTAQVPTAKPTGVPANPKMSGPTASKSGIAVLSPVETVQEFYKTASTKGYLREDLTTQSLRSAVAAQPEIVMQRGNFLGIDPGSVRQSDSAGQKEVQFVLQVRARPPLERAVQFDYANSRWRLPTSMRLIFSGGRWKIDRVRYSAKKRCNTGRSATFFFSDTEYFQAGHPIPGRQLPNPCYLQAGTARPTQY
ncbi:MAG: hypothetical protein KME03_12030 [Aphanocapsa lilacina HA4352-LM1]|nr:hypothetical protein [Aphanocapsa lilacina HA4352-LM1]